MTKIEGVNFVGFSASKTGTEFLLAFDPEQNRDLPESFSVASDDEVHRAMEKANSAFQTYKQISGQKKALFLEAIAEEIMALGDELISRAMAESGLPKGRLEGERGRTVNQIRMFAGLVREGSWVDARIDKAQPDRAPLPKPDIRTMKFPLGPVVVFGASNFPLAFSTAGGDTASALAAGCPVIVKAHESHPGTNEWVARAILKAAQKTNMPDGVFSSLNGGPAVGQALVQHPYTSAVGFTGSLRAGRTIFDLAQQRKNPIPVYAEMGSVNPVFLLKEKLKTSAAEMARQYAASVTLGTGQFCTSPGLLIGVQSDGYHRFAEQLAESLKDVAPSCMLNPGIAKNYRKKRQEIFSQAGVNPVLDPDKSQENGTLGTASLATVKASDFLANKTLHEEVFGPFTLLITCAGQKQMEEVARQLEGQLTVTLMGTPEELASAASLVSICREKAGRVIFNGVPTGVEVCPAMQHGGPYPASTDSKFTSVGTAAVQRFVRPIAFQDCPDELLPDELKDENPQGIYRMVDGEIVR